MGTQNYVIKQGETWRRVLRWEQGTFVYKPITGITKAAPIRLTVVDHEVLDGWRFAVSNVAGMTNINAKNEPPDEQTEYHIATVINSDTLEINRINSLAFSAYTSGGVIRYHPPVDLTGYTARMQFRKKAKDPTILHSLTTENGGIELDIVNGTIILLVPKADTEEFAFTSAVYDLEMVDAGGEVYIPVSGGITVEKNITR